MKKLLKVASAAAVSASLTTGIAAAQQSGVIDTTGPDSDNFITNTVTNSASINQNNGAFALNLNAQGASSGDAEAEENTTVGNVKSGNASNTNSTSTSVTQSSSAGGLWTLGDGGAQSGSMTKTGPDSDNRVDNTQNNSLSVTQSNSAAVLNINLQRASSGDAEAEENTTVGNVESGSASNSNTTSTTIDQSNSL